MNCMNTRTLHGVGLVSFAYCLVGASFTANSVLGDYPYAGGQAVRYALACLLLLPLLGGRAALAPLKLLGPAQWGRIALLAGVGMVGFNLAILAAERTSEPAVPGVFVGCAPVIVAVLVPLADGRRPTRPVLFGALLVAAGAFTVQGWAAPTPWASAGRWPRWRARSGSPYWRRPCSGRSDRSCSRRPCAVSRPSSPRSSDSSWTAPDSCGPRTRARHWHCCGRRPW